MPSKQKTQLTPTGHLAPNHQPLAQVIQQSNKLTLNQAGSQPIFSCISRKVASYGEQISALRGWALLRSWHKTCHWFYLNTLSSLEVLLLRKVLQGALNVLNVCTAPWVLKKHHINACVFNYDFLKPRFFKWPGIWIMILGSQSWRKTHFSLRQWLSGVRPWNSHQQLWKIALKYSTVMSICIIIYKTDR